MILVVDDDDAVGKVLRRILVRGGYKEVTMASSSEEARRLLAQNDFALMLTDMQMPGGSGLELLRHCGENHPGLAAVMVTGSVDSEVADEAVGLGAFGFVRKPFSETEVLSSVSSALQRRQLKADRSV